MAEQEIKIWQPTRWRIGKWRVVRWVQQREIPGTIDNVHVYSSALNEEQIATRFAFASADSHRNSEE
jgi:hypothetical protein